MLFLKVLASDLGIELTEENVESAAKITFINVVFLSLAFTVVDWIGRQLTVVRPVKRIIGAAKKITDGDFSVRISPTDTHFSQEEFNEIADCLNKMAEELSGTETLRTDFIANVSHELKTPLAVIQNYATILSQKNLSEEERLEYSKAISDASRRLNDLITNILKLNKLENQQIAPVFECFDLGEQVSECLLMFEDAWEKKELDIDVDIEDGILVRSDKEMMSLVWNNLFSNAIKFTENGGKVSLSLSSDAEFATVRISDTGCGISTDVGMHIFDKFYQGDTSHTTEGNGLGLALVKRVIDITGNNISVESEIGKGTAFTVQMRRVINE
jgi:signal transduction histidine kinase